MAKYFSQSMNQQILNSLGFREYLANPCIGDWLDYQVWVFLKIYFMPYEIMNKAV